MTPEQARFLFEFLLPQLESEQTITRKILSSVPLEKGVSSRQSCESCEVEVLVPPIACSRADSISDACEGNDARSARM